MRGWKVAPTLSPHTRAGLGWVLKERKDSSLPRKTSISLRKIRDLVREISFVMAIPASSSLNLRR